MSSFEQQTMNPASGAGEKSTDFDNWITLARRLPPDGRRRCVAAIERGYFVEGAREQRPDRNGYNAYYQWCKSQNAPFIHATKGRQYAKVVVDLFPCWFDLPSSAFGAVLRAGAPYQKDGNSWGSAGQMWVEHRQIPFVLLDEAVAAIRGAVLDRLVPVER